MISPTDCIAKDFNTKWYKKWSKKIGYPAAKHPKFWESAIIVQALKDRRCLKKDNKALVFGIGTEQLASLFADMNIYVTATDQDPNSEESKKWDNGQLAKNENSIFYPEIVDKAKFDKYITYKSYDMNKNNPAFYDKYDFIWHNCVIGHLGSMKKSLKHLERSSKYLKNNGWLVFTTELNISNPDKTVDKDSDTIIWRLQDLYNMFERLAEVGLKADRIKLRLGKDSEDIKINYDNAVSMSFNGKKRLRNPDYSEIKIAFANYAITQIVLSFKKTTVKSAKKMLKHHKKDMIKNQAVINEHIKINKDLEDYYTNYNEEDLTFADIVPVKKQFNIDAKAGDLVPVTIKFRNNSKLSVFGFGPHWPMNHGPLVLATSDPINRDSKLYCNSWSSPNRPAIVFKNSSTASMPKQLNLHKQRAKSGDIFEYNFSILAPAKLGKYIEKFILVFEGRGIVSKSEVSLKLTVKPKPKEVKTKKMINMHNNERELVTPRQYFEIINWDKIFPKNEKLKEAFIEWLGYLANDSFRIKTTIHTEDFKVFLNNYIKDNNYDIDNIDIIDEVIYKTFDKYDIKINEIDDGRTTGEPLLFVLSTPRSGNTAITEAITRVTGIRNVSLASMDKSNFSRANEPTIVKIHISQQDFSKKYISKNLYKVITIKRHPLDALLSAYRFSQKSLSNATWLDGKVFSDPDIYKGYAPNSKEFENWAISDGAKAFLEVTASWYEKCDVLIKYEDFIKDGTATIKKAIKDLKLDKQYSTNDINAGVKDIQDNFLITSFNEHRWTGSMDNWQKYIPKETAIKIYKVHKEVFDLLGYDLSYPVKYTEVEIIKNNKNWR